MPYDGISLYECGCVVQRVSGSGAFYMGVEGVQYDRQTMINIIGGTTHDNQHYFAAAGIDPGTAWAVYRGYFQGWTGSTAGGQARNSSAPGKMRTGAVYVRPLFICNYPAVAGQVKVAAIWVRRLGGALNAKDAVDVSFFDADGVGYSDIA